jgi:hypothetical protein
MVQLVITPETDFEKNALSTFQDHELDAKIYSGSFYDCRGGWIRQTEHHQQGYAGMSHNSDKSLIMTIKTNENNQGVKIERGEGK